MLKMNRRKTIVLGLLSWGFLILGSSSLIRTGFGVVSPFDLWQLVGLKGTLIEFTAKLLHSLIIFIAAGVALASTGALIASLVNPNPGRPTDAENGATEDIAG